MASSHHAESALDHAVCEVLRSCIADGVIDAHADVLQETAAVSTAIAGGMTLREAVRTEVIAAIARQPAPERKALRIMAGLAAGWGPSVGKTREDRKNAMGQFLLRGGAPMPGEQVSSRRVEQLERSHLAPAIARALNDVAGAHGARSPRDYPIFAQFINPEMVNLYGERALLNDPQRVHHRLGWTTRLALLSSGVGIVFPASYIFEVPGLAEFLIETQPVWEAGAIRLTAPLADLEEYKQVKRSEYRDEAENPYANSVRELGIIARGIQWRPRQTEAAQG